MALMYARAAFLVSLFTFAASALVLKFALTPPPATLWIAIFSVGAMAMSAAACVAVQMAAVFRYRVQQNG